MAAKIKDGLFIGDADTSRDTEFLELNKISSLINFAGMEVDNAWSTQDIEGFEIFDPRNEVLSEICSFVDSSLSLNGTSRCIAAACAYLMSKYGWGFEKAYDFIYSKKPDIELNRGFIEQLFTLDKKLRAGVLKSLHSASAREVELLELRTESWDSSYVQEALQKARHQHNRERDRERESKRFTGGSSSPFGDISLLEEELVLVNSFNNGKPTINALPGPYHDAMRTPKNFKLKFNPAGVQVAEVHLLSTQPPHRSYAPPRGGILKGVIKKSSPSMAGQTDVSYRTEDFIAANRSARSSSSEESADRDRGGGGGGDRQAPPKSGGPEGKKVPPPVRGSWAEDSVGTGGGSQISHASADLYDFVGLGGGESVPQSLYGQPPPKKTQSQPASRNAPPAPASNGNSVRGSTPAERLHSLLQGLQRNVETKIDQDRKLQDDRGSAPPRRVPVAEAKSSARTTDFASKDSRRYTPGDPSLHDVASMEVRPSFSHPAGGGVRPRVDDGWTSSGGPVRARRDVLASDFGGSKGHNNNNGLSSSGGWVGGAHNGNGAGAVRQNSTAPGAAKPKSPGQTYRHGSPAPQLSKDGLVQSTRQALRTATGVESSGSWGSGSVENSISGVNGVNGVHGRSAMNYSSGPGGDRTRRSGTPPARQQPTPPQSTSQAVQQPTASSQRRTVSREFEPSRRPASATRTSLGGSVDMGSSTGSFSLDNNNGSAAPRRSGTPTRDRPAGGGAAVQSAEERRFVSPLSSRPRSATPTQANRGWKY